MNSFAIRRLSACVMAVLVAAGSACAQHGPEQLGAHWARVTDRLQEDFQLDALRAAAPGSAALRLLQLHASSAVENARGSSLTAIPSSVRTALLSAGTAGFSAGATFLATPISAEHHIDRLTRDVTRGMLGRAIFSTPGPTASYSLVHYTQDAPFVTGTYVQFVVDATWNRVVYGSMDRWIRSFDNLIGPTSVAVDAFGRVFIGEAGRRQVTVLQLQGEGDAAQLRPLFTIPDIASPSAVAVSDNGTPLDFADDVLYVADASRGVVLKYRLGSTGGVLAATTEGFTSPTAITVGRWNGANTASVYVIDQLARRVRVFEDTGTPLSPIAEYRGDYTQYFSALTADHFGNIYLADQTDSRVLKLTSALEYLDEDGGTGAYDGLAGVSIPFGRIVVDGQGTSWAGFDQLFAVERWTNGSGAQRRTLGLRAKDILFAADADVSSISCRFVLTDFGTVGARVYDASGNLVRLLAAAPMVSGRKELVWDRRDEHGTLVPPGEYQYELDATSPYGSETARAQARWTLPLFYEEQAGGDQPHCIQGSAVTRGGVDVTEDAQAVRYLFNGLTPAGTYCVAVEYIAPDGIARSQDLSTGDGVVLHAPVTVGASRTRVDFVAVPASAFASCTLALSVNRRGEGSAVVARLVLKEIGTSFTARPVEKVVPTTYVLEQNFPNPFNPSTVIRYGLPEAGRVTLVIYDVTGREVARMVNEEKAAGSYEIRFDAGSVRPGGLASGMYLYRLSAGNFSTTRKMVIVR